LYVDSVFAISVTDVNDAPTDIALSANTVAENQPSATIGLFSSSDADANETSIIRSSTAWGSDDNDAFSIDDFGALLSTSAFNFESSRCTVFACAAPTQADSSSRKFLRSV